MASTPPLSTAEIVFGRRIVIYGATGSGKTSLSQQIGRALALPVLQLDAIRHDGAWDATSWDEMRERVQAFVEAHPDGWVCEGNYSRVQDVTLSRADTLISLDLPWRVSFWRLLGRTLRRSWNKQALYSDQGPRETWRISFFSRQSILLWSITNHQHRKRSTAASIAKAPPGTRIFRARTTRDVDSIRRAALESHAPALED